MDYKKCLLILGTGLDQVPGIKKAKELNLYTIGLDINSYSPGAKLVDEFYNVSVKNINQVINFVKNYNKRKINGVIAFGVDIPHILAKVADILNISYYTSYKLSSISQNKYLAKNLLNQYNIKLPYYQKITSLESLKKAIHKINYPCVLKPIDNCGARGVIRITKGIDIEWAYNFSKKYSKKGELILEKFLDGPQISSESIIINNKVYTVGLAYRNYEFLEKFSPFIIENGGDLPPDCLNEYLQKAIDIEIEKAARAFKVSNGIIKADIVIHNHEVYIIEIALRLSGGHLSSIEIPLNTGIDFLKYSILLSLNVKDIDTKQLQYKSINYVSLRYIFPHKKGIINEISFPKFIQNNPLVYDYGLYYQRGDKTSYPVKNHTERLGYFIVASKDKQQIQKIISNIYNSFHLKID